VAAAAATRARARAAGSEQQQGDRGEAQAEDARRPSQDVPKTRSVAARVRGQPREVATVPRVVGEEGREAGGEQRARAAEAVDLGIGGEGASQVAQRVAQGRRFGGQQGRELREAEAGELGEHERGPRDWLGRVGGEEAGEGVGGGRERGRERPEIVVVVIAVGVRGGAFGVSGRLGDAPGEVAEPGAGARVGGQQAVALGEQEAAQHGVVDHLEVGAEPVEDGAHAAGVAAMQREQAPATEGERRVAGRGHAPAW